jgi:mannose-6-phosphate isomerase-like protein (cupin superfamily)
MEVVNLEDKFARFDEHWSPKIIARLNDYHVKAVKLRGAFVWHKHDQTDELFLVTKGTLVIRFRDRDVTLDPGELLVVPRGVEHLPVAEEECEVLLLEPAGTRNTGDAGGARTVAPEWI